MYMCDVCGYASEKAGVCPSCVTPLTQYTKEDQREYQVDMEEGMRTQSMYKWYV